MSMFDSSKEGGISFLILDAMVETDGCDQIVNDVDISFGHCKMQRYFSFSLFGMIQQLLKRCIILDDRFCFILDSFLQFGHIQFQLRQ